MYFSVKTIKAKADATSCLEVGLFEEKKLSPCLANIDKQNNKALSTLIKNGDFTGELGQTQLLYSEKGHATRLLVVGCGKKADFNLAKFNKVVQAAACTAKNMQLKDVAYCMQDLETTDATDNSKLQQAILGIHQATYSFTEFKSKNEPQVTTKWTWLVEGKTSKDTDKVINQMLATVVGMKTTKDLANTPGNICTPTYLAKEAKKLATKSPKLTCKVLNEKEMKKLGMGSFLAVAQGSIQPPQLIVLEYKGGKSGDKPVAIVGKGITFDTGGVSLKQPLNMIGMKFDMCGAATVMGVMQAISTMKLPINVVGFMACAENMPSHKSSRPDDVVTSMSGQAIEISNTDAEGRLVLCDTITYSQKKYQPKEIIDIATLTGACVVALGNHATGLFSNHQPLADALLKAGTQIHDRAWQMPIWDDYQEQLDSQIADVNNVGGPAAGAVTAACFLSRFTKGVNWAHLDVAGTSSMMKAGVSATGRPVPMLVQYLINKCSA